jgi:hypothetical protein
MASSRTLLIIDIQRDYFPGGAYPLVDPEAAAAEARKVLDSFRDAGQPVVHMKHVWDAPDAEFMRPGTEGVEIRPEVEPADGELVLEKASPNSFVDTALEKELRERDTKDLVVAGMMSSMCVDATRPCGGRPGFLTDRRARRVRGPEPRVQRDRGSWGRGPRGVHGRARRWLCRGDERGRIAGRLVAVAA